MMFFRTTPLLSVTLAIALLNKTGHGFRFLKDGNSERASSEKRNDTDDDESFLKKAIGKVKKTVTSLLNRLNFGQIFSLYKRAKDSEDYSVKGLLGILRNGDSVKEKDLDGVNLKELGSLFSGNSNHDGKGESGGFSGISKSIEKLDKLQSAYQSVQTLKRTLSGKDSGTESGGSLGALAQMGSLLSGGDSSDREGHRRKDGKGDDSAFSGISRSLSQLDTLQKTYNSVNELRRSFGSSEDDNSRHSERRRNNSERDESGGLMSSLMKQFNRG